MRSEPHARGRGRALASCPGGGGDLHGLRHRRLPRLRRAAPPRRLRPRVHGGTGLPRWGRRLERAPVAPALRGGSVTPDLSVDVGSLRLRAPVLATPAPFGSGTEVPL